MLSPYKGTFRVSQAYLHLRSDGTYHQGYDLVGISDKHIYSPVFGTVERAGWENPILHGQGFGQYVRIRIGATGYRMYFGHLSGIAVKAGQTVTPGTPLGIEGSTGHSTGSHLHLEIRNGTAKTSYVSVANWADILNTPSQTAYTSTWREGLLGPDTLKRGASSYPACLYNATLQGLLGLSADGIFGAGTETAVKAYQAKHGLTADGKVGAMTKAALIGAGV